VNSLRSSFLPVEQLPDYVQLARRFFPNEDWANGVRRLKRLLVRWPEGIFAVRGGSELIGYICLWPLTATAARRIVAGMVRDNDLDGIHIPARVSRPHKNWICTAVAALPGELEIRRSVVRLLVGRLNEIANQHRPCVIFAHAVTEAGRRFCLRNGFQFDLTSPVPELCRMLTK
jgi:hypothetical protein